LANHLKRKSYNLEQGLDLEELKKEHKNNLD